jgi:hypothetical protein
MKRSASRRTSQVGDMINLLFLPVQGGQLERQLKEVKEAPHKQIRKKQGSLKDVLWLRQEMQGQVMSSRKFYTLRRVDRHHPRRPRDYTRGENQSIINWNEDLYEWTIELHDHRFWSNFQADWYISVIKDRKNPITS